MSVNSKWNISQHGKEPEPVKMAEPVHRIPPGGVTTSQSLRTVPKSCIQQVKEICLFYVKKCSGSYIDNKAAARYVHQMADEIILQLSGVASQIKRTRGEPEIYQALIDEWNEHFPPSLGAMGSPKAIANIVNMQNREITKLREELQHERSSRENDVSSILRSMDAQLHAYRTSVIADKQQQKFNFDEELAEKDRKMRDMMITHEEEQKQSQKAHLDALRDIKAKCDRMLQGAKMQRDELERAHKKQLNTLYQKVKTNMTLFQEKNGLLRDRMQELREKYNNLAMILHQDLDVPTSEEEEDSDEDTEDLLSLEDLELHLADDDNEYGNEEKKGKEDGDVQALLQQRKEAKAQRQQMKAQQQEERKQQRLLQRKGQTSKRNSSSSSGSSDLDEHQIKELRESHIASLVKIRELEKENNMLRNQTEGLKKELEKLLSKLTELIKEREAHLSHLRQFEIINETLRCALYKNVKQEGLSEEALTSHIVHGETEMLCHTPHFLDRPDRGGPYRVTKKISAYKQPGHF